MGKSSVWSAEGGCEGAVGHGRSQHRGQRPQPRRQPPRGGRRPEACGEERPDFRHRL